MAIAIFCSTAAASAADFQWNPPAGSDWQWTNSQNWISSLGGVPSASDAAVFTHLAQPAASSIARADPDPNHLPPTWSILSVGGIRADGYFAYDGKGEGTDDWRVELARFVFDENQAHIATSVFSLDLANGEGVVQVGYFEEPTIFGEPAYALPGGLTITGRSKIGDTTYSAAVGFRGTVDVRHGRLTLQDINYDDHDPLSTLGGLVDSRDDLSYIPQRLPNAHLTVDHSHFDSVKTRGLLIGSIGRAEATLKNGTVLSNLKELRVGGNSGLGQASHESSNLTMIDSSVTVGDGASGHVYIGDLSAPDLIDTYNGTLTMTRSSIAPSPILDGQGAVIGAEPLDVYVGNFGHGRAQLDDASSITARRMFVGEKLQSFGELRLTSSSVTLVAPDGPETSDHAGRFSVGSQGLGFVVIAGATDAPSNINARSMTLGTDQNAYGDVYIDRDSTLTLADSASIGINGQGRLTITGRFDSHDAEIQRNIYHTTTATVGVRPSPISLDPSRKYSVTVGKVWASAGYLVIGEGGRLDVTDQPLTGLDELDEQGVELWRSTNHRLTVGDDGLGWFTVHADGVVRAECLEVGQTALGVGHVVLDKVLLNASAVNLDHAVPGTVNVSRNTVIGVNGVGTVDVRGPYVPRGGSEPDTFAAYGLLTASLTVGENAGSSGTVRTYAGGQIIVNGTLPGEQDLVVAREGAASLEVGDLLVLSGSGPFTHVSGGTGATVRVTDGVMQIGGADATLFPAAKGTVTVNPNGLLDVRNIILGGTSCSGDSLTTHPGADAVVSLPGGGTEVRTFAGGTVWADHVEIRGNTHLAIESNPTAGAPDPRRDGGFHAENGVDVYGGVVRLGTVERTTTGTLDGDLNLHAGRLIGGGRIDGNVTAEGGDVAVLVNGATRYSEYDSYDVTGVATFTSGGIVVDGSIVGQIGQQFDLFTFSSGSRTTSFDVVTSLATQPGTQWVSFLDADSYTLAVAGATGDTNFDGAVNFDDLLTLAQNYGGGGTQSWITGDFNDDQLVNFDDLLVLAQNYGSNLISGSDLINGSFAGDWAMAMSMVPEPTSLFAFATSSALLLKRRRAEVAPQC